MVELSPPPILQPPLVPVLAEEEKERGGKRKREHVFGWLSDEIRDRKHLGRGDGKPHYLFGRFIRWSWTPQVFTRLWGDSSETSAQSTNLTRRDTTTSFLISTKRYEGVCILSCILSRTLFLPLSRLLNCLVTNRKIIR